MPIEYSDLPFLAQTSLSIYNDLRDDWDYMNGNYIGKSLLNLFQVFRLYDIPKVEYILVYKLIMLVDSQRRALIQGKSKT
jgi:hypothetical protein